MVIPIHYATLGRGKRKDRDLLQSYKVYHYGKHMAQRALWYWISINKMNVVIFNLELPRVGHKVTGNIAAWMLREYS